MERVLVRVPNWLGDALLARPLLHALSGVRPRAELRAVGPAPILDLLAADSLEAAWEPWPDRREARGALTARLAAWRPDAALVLPPSFSSAWFAWRTGATRRVGYAHEGRGPLLTHALRRPARGELHLADEYLALGRALGVDPAPTPTLGVREAARGAARELLQSRGFAGGPVAILGPGAIYGPAKRWAPERFAALADTLARDGFQVLVCGAAADRALCAAVAARAAERVLTLAGETSLGLQAGLLAGAALAVCNDSGLAHLAAAVGTPTVVIFGSTSSAWTAPRGPRVRVVQHAPVCSPCFQRTCAIGYRCLAAIAVADVERACREVAA